jgi:succinate dehydrogenase/fumarate reductase flavoprotein subunit
MTDWSREELAAGVLVIGAGAAGLRAAIAAKDSGADVLVVTKGKLASSGATFDNINNEWGYQAAAAFRDKTDNPEKHFQEIVDMGLGMVNNELAWLVAQNAYDRLTDLEAYGIRFKREGDKYAQIVGCFSNVPRVFVTEDMNNVRDAFRQVIERRGIRVLEDTQITRLLVADNRCYGAAGIRGERGFVKITAPATIMAAGGGASIFQYNLAPRGATGDGYVLGFEAGAALINMEFIQAMLGTPPMQKRNFLPLGVFKDGPHFLNCFGEEFLEKYYPTQDLLRNAYKARLRHYPFSARDEAKFIDIGIAKEVLAGKTSENFGVFVKKERDTSGAVLPGGQAEVAPFAHAFNGGLAINFEAETGVTSLFAAGEAAGGAHGADRLGGNMMPAAQVLGERAGKSAALRATRPAENPRAAECAEEEFSRLRAATGPARVDFSHTLDHMRWMMWKKCLVVRKGDNLSSALRTVDNLNDLADQVRCSNVREYVSLKSMLALSRIILTAALRRKETRGSHYREDFPEKDDKNFGKPTMIHKDSLEEAVV